MKKRYIQISSILLLVLILFSTSSQAAKAESLSLPNPGAIIPVPSGKYATYSQGPHKSGFSAAWGITNANSVTSSIDLAYAGTVVAPIGGFVAILNDCGDHQIAVIRNSNGWAIGLTHVYINPEVRRKSVSQGQVIGKTVKPLSKDKSKGCGYGVGNLGHHIHYTLMTWVQGKTVQHTEQNIVNTYLAKWIVKTTYLDGSKYDIKIGQVIK